MIASKKAKMAAS